MTQQVKAPKSNQTFQVNGEDVNLTPQIIRDTLVRGNGEVTNQEVTMFLSLCKYQKLNPFLNEAYIIKFGHQPASLIVSKEAFMKRAESHSQYRGLEAGIIVARKDKMIDLEGAVKLPDDQLIGGWAKVKRDDRETPIVVRIALEEFSKGQATWKQMPMNMIRKSAVVNALREAFPESLGAMYTEDDADPKTEAKPMFEVQQEIDQNANQQPIDIEPANQDLPEPTYENETPIIEQREPEKQPVDPNPYQEPEQASFNDKDDIPF